VCQAQFGALQTITSELTGGTDRPVQIIGLNMSRYTGSSFTLNQMTMGRAMPWLRCVTGGGANDPSVGWAFPDGTNGTRAPLYRELVILNHRNEFVLGFDLASQPIDGATHAAQRAVVRDALRTAAALADTDADRLPDAWELDEFGTLAAVTADTPTTSGLTALLAYGLGQSPHAATEDRGLRLTRGGGSFRLSYTRRLARRPALLWTFERSQDLSRWLDWLDLTGGTATTQFDGTGTERITHSLPETGAAVEAFRLNLSLGPDPSG